MASEHALRELTDAIGRLADSIGALAAAQQDGLPIAQQQATAMGNLAMALHQAGDELVDVLR